MVGRSQLLLCVLVVVLLNFNLSTVVVTMIIRIAVNVIVFFGFQVLISVIVLMKVGAWFIDRSSALWRSSKQRMTSVLGQTSTSRIRDIPLLGRMTTST